MVLIYFYDTHLPSIFDSCIVRLAQVSIEFNAVSWTTNHIARVAGSIKPQLARFFSFLESALQKQDLG